MKSTAKRHALIAIGTLAALAGANLAAATPEVGETRTTVVRYTDLDPSRPEYEKCLGQAVTEAVEKVQSEQVSAIRRAHN
jgi:hypothetical protein